jgi:hypothetical protein
MKRYERGFSSVVMLAALVPLLVVAGTLLSVISGQMRATETMEARARARSIAAGGAHDAIARLQADPGFTGEFTVGIEAGTAFVTVVDCENDGIDDDQDGRIDDDAEKGLVLIRSEGFLGIDVDESGNVLADHGRNWRGFAEVVLRRTSLEATFDAALYVDDPHARVRFSGNSFLVSGRDVGLDGKPDHGATFPGIGTPGNPAPLKSQFTKSQRNNVVGKGGTPSVLQVGALDLPDLLATLAPLATIHWDPGASAKGPIGDRAAGTPVIAHARGDLKIAGHTTGYGILLVDGDLELDGAFEFVGIIVVGRSLKFRGGGSRTLLGTVLTSSDLDDGSDLKGSMTIQYSSQAIDAVRSVASGFAIVAWRQD